MGEAPDIREQEDCPSGQSCAWSCDQHPNPVKDIVDRVVKHFEENPRHGAGCACMDAEVRNLRFILAPFKDAMDSASNPNIYRGLTSVLYMASQRTLGH